MGSGERVRRKAAAAESECCRLKSHCQNSCRRWHRPYQQIAWNTAEVQRPWFALLASGAVQAPETYQRRIAALDDIAGAVRAALYKAPGDAFVNQAYLQTMGERAKALRQLGTAMPVGTRLASY